VRKGVRMVCMFVHLPEIEMEVHARGEDHKDHDLETVHGCKFGYTTRCGRRTGMGTSTARLSKVFMRFTHLKEQRCE